MRSNLRLKRQNSENCGITAGMVCCVCKGHRVYFPGQKEVKSVRDIGWKYCEKEKEEQRLVEQDLKHIKVFL